MVIGRLLAVKGRGLFERSPAFSGSHGVWFYVGPLIDWFGLLLMLFLAVKLVLRWRRRYRAAVALRANLEATAQAYAALRAEVDAAAAASSVAHGGAVNVVLGHDGAGSVGRGADRCGVCGSVFLGADRGGVAGEAVLGGAREFLSVGPMGDELERRELARGGCGAGGPPVAGADGVGFHEGLGG